MLMVHGACFHPGSSKILHRAGAEPSTEEARRPPPSLWLPGVISGLRDCARTARSGPASAPARSPARSQPVLPSIRFSLFSWPSSPRTKAAFCLQLQQGGRSAVPPAARQLASFSSDSSAPWGGALAVPAGRALSGLAPQV